MGTEGKIQIERASERDERRKILENFGFRKLN